MRTYIARAALLAAVPLCLPVNPAAAQSQDIRAVRDEIRSMREAYENRISALEAQLKQMEAKETKGDSASGQARRARQCLQSLRRHHSQRQALVVLGR